MDTNQVHCYLGHINLSQLMSQLYMHYPIFSGPSDLVLSGTNTTRLSITGLHIDPAQGSPTTFTFNLTTQDYANLSSTDTAVLLYHKGTYDNKMNMYMY